MPPRAVLNFMYARMTAEMDRKQRDDFDATLNSGVGDESWARIEARAFSRLRAGDDDEDGR